MLCSSEGILAQGYHSLPDNTGVYVARGLVPPRIPLDEAIRAITRLFEDNDYITTCDKHRMTAFALAPAMGLGGILDVDTPILYLEADRPGAGKSFSQDVLAAIHGETPYVVNVIDRGVGGLDESIAQGMVNGRRFIKIDNIETEFHSSYLSTSSTHRRVVARILYRSVEVHPHRHIFMANSNGAKITPELVRRFAPVRIRKRPVDFIYNYYKEGDVLEHVRANQPYYLGAVFSVIREYLEAGKPRTSEQRHSFRRWAQSLDWIMRNIFQTGESLFADYEDNGQPPPLGPTAYSVTDKELFSTG